MFVGYGSVELDNLPAYDELLLVDDAHVETETARPRAWAGLVPGRLPGIDLLI